MSFSRRTFLSCCSTGDAPRARRHGWLPASPGCFLATAGSTRVRASFIGSFAWQRRAPASRYLHRHRVKPGITGWAQVSGLRGEVDTLEKAHARVAHNLYYIEHWSPWLDLKILLKTVGNSW